MKSSATVEFKKMHIGVEMRLLNVQFILILFSVGNSMYIANSILSLNTKS